MAVLTPERSGRRVVPDTVEPLQPEYGTAGRPGRDDQCEVEFRCEPHADRVRPVGLIAGARGATP